MLIAIMNKRFLLGQPYMIHTFNITQNKFLDFLQKPFEFCIYIHSNLSYPQIFLPLKQCSLGSTVLLCQLGNLGRKTQARRRYSSHTTLLKRGDAGKSKGKSPENTIQATNINRLLHKVLIILEFLTIFKKSSTVIPRKLAVLNSRNSLTGGFSCCSLVKNLYLQTRDTFYKHSDSCFF